MNSSQDLNSLVDACVVAIDGDKEAGRNLARGESGVDDAASKWHRIKQAFDDTRNIDWIQIHGDGLAILRDASKDLLAVWALLAPVPAVQGHGLKGMQVSIDVCNLFLSKYWESMFPSLPEGLNLRVSILKKLVGRWTTFANQTTPTEDDVDVIVELVKGIDELESFLEERIPGTIAIEGLKQRLVAFRRQFPRDEDRDGGSGKPADAPEQRKEHTAEPPRPEVESGNAGVKPSNVGAPSGDVADLERAVADAIRIVDSAPQRALQEFEALADNQASRARRFRARVYLGELYLRAGHAQLARQVLSFLDEEREKIRLEDWEPELCGKLWATLYQTLVAEHTGEERPKDVQEKLGGLFAQVCRVDPKQALNLKTV